MYGSDYTVSDVMTRSVVALTAGAPFKDIVRTVRTRRISALPVVDVGNRVVGVVSEAYLLRKEEFRDSDRQVRRGTGSASAHDKARGVTAADLMTSPAITVHADETLAGAARVMARRGIKRMPVVDADGVLRGIVSRGDLLRVFLRPDQEIAEEVLREVARGRLPGSAGALRVEVHEGVVTLAGEVGDTAVVPLVEGLTRSVEGVVDVRCELSGPRHRSADGRESGANSSGGDKEAAHRRPDEETPLNDPAPSDEEVIGLVGDAVAAPSMHNAQPWRFRYVRHTRTFELHADYDRAMPYSDPRTRGLHIGCGAALLNLRVALADEGWQAETRLLPHPEQPSLVATVRLSGRGGGDRDLAALHGAVAERHSSRFPFEERRIADSLRGALAEAARREGATLVYPASWHLQQVLDLVREAEARGLTDSESDRELAEWTRTDAPSVNGAADGVPAYAFGPVRSGGKAPMRDFAGPRRVSGRNSAVFEAAPQIACVSTTHDRPEDWVRAGQALERVLLLATAEGLVCSLATQPLERPDLRWLLRDPKTGAGHPQMLLRLGYGPVGPRTPRRPVADVLELQS